MSLRFVSAALAGTMLAASIYAAPVELGRQVFHQDWAAACDNILACEAVSLLAEDEADRLPTMVVSRANDASDAVSAKISLVEPRGTGTGYWSMAGWSTAAFWQKANSPSRSKAPKH
jgi:disulfide bond formation protein DsbB